MQINRWRSAGDRGDDSRGVAGGSYVDRVGPGGAALDAVVVVVGEEDAVLRQRALVLGNLDRPGEGERQAGEDHHVGRQQVDRCRGMVADDSVDVGGCGGGGDDFLDAGEQDALEAEEAGQVADHLRIKPLRRGAPGCRRTRKQILVGRWDGRGRRRGRLFFLTLVFFFALGFLLTALLGLHKDRVGLPWCARSTPFALPGVIVWAGTGSLASTAAPPAASAPPSWVASVIHASWAWVALRRQDQQHDRPRQYLRLHEYLFHERHARPARNVGAHGLRRRNDPVAAASTAEANIGSNGKRVK